MARRFRELQGRMSPESQQRTHDRVQGELLRQSLQDIRRNVSHLTALEVAGLLETSRGILRALESRAAPDRR